MKLCPPPVTYQDIEKQLLGRLILARSARLLWRAAGPLSERLRYGGYERGWLICAWAAANRAIGTRNGEQET